MQQTHQVTIHRNAQGFEHLERKLVEYFRKNKVEGPIAENGGVRYVLGDGLNVFYSKNGEGVALMTIVGSKARVEKGVSVLREMYSGAIDVVYDT